MSSAKLVESIAQWSTGDLNKAVEGMLHIHDQKDRAGYRQRAEANNTENGSVARRQQTEAEKECDQPKHENRQKWPRKAGLAPLKHQPMGFLDVAADLQGPREKPALSLRLRCHGPQLDLNRLNPRIVADGVGICNTAPSVSPDLEERRFHELAKLSAGFPRFRTIVRHDPVEQDSAGDRVSQLRVGGVKRGLCRSNQQAESQRRERRDDRRGQLDRILGVRTQVIAGNTAPSAIPRMAPPRRLAKTIPPTAKGPIDVVASIERQAEKLES
jgi:hypothetical protein